MTWIFLTALSIGWCTDIHLDHASEEAYRDLLGEIRQQELNTLIISGDVSNGYRVCEHLQRLQEDTGLPLYFVLGNHDFYHSSIAKVRSEVEHLVEEQPDLHYLTIREEPVLLADDLILIGHDAWADGLEGDFLASPVMLNDYILIEELANLSKEERLAFLSTWGQDSAEILESRIIHALEMCTEVLLVMHPPPYRHLSLYNGEPANDDWAPHFVCKTVGEMLLRVMSDHPQKRLTVLCGHSHHVAYGEILPNLRVHVGSAMYGYPCLQKPDDTISVSVLCQMEREPENSG